MPEITFDTAVRGDRVDQPWSLESPNHLFHYRKHPTRDPDGNPVIVRLHGGGTIGGDARDLFLGTTGDGCLAYYLLNVQTGAKQRHWDICSFQIDQWKREIAGVCTGGSGGANQSICEAGGGVWHPRDQTGNSHSQTATLKWGPPLNNQRDAYPSAWQQVKKAILFLKPLVRALGGDPAKMAGMGASAGTTIMGWGQITDPLTAEEVNTDGHPLGKFALEAGSDSRLKGLLYSGGQTDFRKGPAYIIGRNGAIATTEVSPTYQTCLYLGVLNEAQLPLLPDAVRNDASIQWHLEQGHTKWIIPHYVYYEDRGQATSYPWLDVHDEQQGTDLCHAADLAGVGHLFARQCDPAMFPILDNTTWPLTPWDDAHAAQRDIVNVQVATWLNRLLPVPQPHML